MVVPTAPAFFRQRGVALLVLLVLTIYGFEAHARRRENSLPATLGDQNAYLGYAQHLYESNYTVVEDRNRMPVYPFLLSLIYRPGMTETEFLVRAQTFTVNISIVLLLLLFFIFRRFFPPLYSLALLAATAFGVFLYRAGKAQTELLFYFISFCAFVLLLRMLVKPQWWLAVLAGATTGLAHLTKASVLPALAVWAVVFGAQILWDHRRRPWSRLAMLALVPAAFLAVVFPYIQTSKKIYDAYFYNVNSTFVMWCDSSSQAYEFLSAHGNKGEWRKLPPDQLPSFRKYWREHSVAQIARRISNGSLDLATQNARAIGYYKFVIALLIAAVLLATRQRTLVREVVAQNRFAAAFCVMFFAGYFLLYAWYDAIINDTRFVLSIFLPFVFAASLFVLRLGRERVISQAGRRIPFEQFFAGLLLGLALIDVLYSAPNLTR
jgi:4-amino-4-deoxy-L-arabinose transferase-like glycosyltransferase